MAYKSQPLNGVCYIAWNPTLGAGQTGDVANHVLRLIIDGVEAVPSGVPFEVDPLNCPGLYKINLSAQEMSSSVVVLAGKSTTPNVSIIPVQLTTILSITQTIINQGPGIWANSYLNQLAADAIGQIAIDVNCIWAREYLPTQSGVSVITLPSYIRTVRRVTWLGRSLDPENWEELQMLTPATVFVSPNNPANVESSQGKPLYYAMHPTNPWDIRLFPTPNQTFTPSSFPTDPYSPQFNEQACSVEYYREPDTTNTNPVISLPPYILRRIQKAYVLWKAYAAEGKGQDLTAASYYQMKYTFLINQFRAINEGCFVGKKYAVDDGMLTIDNFRYPRPTLPSRGYKNLQFERVIF